MNDRQRDYFRAKLLAWKDEILRNRRITLQTLQEENVNHPDLADRASSETDRAIELRARDRQRKLISKTTPRCSGSTTTPTAIARRPRADLAEAAGSPPIATLRWRRRSATRNARRSIGTSSFDRRARFFCWQNRFRAKAGSRRENASKESSRR